MGRGSCFLIVLAAALIALPASAAAAPGCTIKGGPGSDVLRGTKQADVICARGGADEVFGHGGADVIWGGRGGDTLRGGAGADRLLGGGGRDTCLDSRTTYADCERRPRRGRGRVRFPFPHCCVALPSTPGAAVPDVTDVTAPRVRDVYFYEPFVDTSSEDSIGLWIEAEEHQSGVGTVEVELEGPDGPWRKLTFESEYPHAGAGTSVEVPSSTPAGKYRVSGLRLADRAGNLVSFDAVQLAEAGLDAEFDVFAGPDEEGPQLTGYTLSPASLDTSAGPGSVLFQISATDDLSGVGDAAVLIRLPEAPPFPCFPCGHRGASQLVEGTIYDGVWEEELPLPRFAMPGTYSVAALVLYDRAGNRTDFGREELEDLGYPVDFTQTGAGDTEPPEIVDFWMNPGTLQTSSGNQAIQLFIHVTDDLSGLGETEDSNFERLRVDIQPPHASEWWLTNGGMTQVSGTELDGIWRFEYILPVDAEVGTWTIPAIEATDHAGNETLLQGKELKATGWDLTFENLP